MRRISKFVEGVWVGFLDEIGFVIFDPDIKNLYSTRTDGESVCLWVKNKPGWAYFNLEDIRPKLKANLPNVTQFARERMASFYFDWRCEVEGADSCDGFTESDEECDRLWEEHKNNKNYEDAMSDEDAYFNVLKDRV